MSHDERDLCGLTLAELQQEVSDLGKAAVVALDPCLTAKLIALLNADVQTHFLSKCQAGYPFRGIQCLRVMSIPEHRYVLFEFACKPNTVCLIDPSFVVVVNMVTGQVVPPIIDPYLPKSYLQSKSDCGCGHADRISPSRRRCYRDSNSDLDRLIAIVEEVFSAGVGCNSVLTSASRCRNSNRCFEGFRILEEFLEDPSRATVRRLNEWINASSMQEQCMRAIIEYTEAADWGSFLAIIAAILG